MKWIGVKYWANRVLTRPRTFLRAAQKIGVPAALSLVRIRMGSRRKVYELRVPQWPHPIYVRGGTSSDAVVLYEILVTNEYEHIGDLGSPKFIIDGGANIGLASAYLLNRYPAASVVAVEPDAETIELCRRNLASFAGRVTTVQGAIWSRRGDLFLDPSDQEWTATIRSPRDGETASIQASTMQDLIALGDGKRVDLLKLDVEGSEREIFGPDATEWLSSVENIVVELHGPDCMERFLSVMSRYRSEMSNRDSVYVCRNIRPLAL
jgi:FkbM family methyltransferase